jgi:hypothetical protein
VPPERLGTEEVAAFLEAEGGHAKQHPVAIFAALERAQRLQGPIPEFGLQAEEEAARMGKLHGE